MIKNMRQTLMAGCDALGLELNEGQVGNLLKHVELLEKWNRTHNLTAITAPGDMVVQHLLDSLAIFPWIKPGRLLDVGSGGGFPGLPLAIVDSELDVVLLDSRGKRVRFLRHVCGRVGLQNVTLENCRVENYKSETKFDTLTARAFTSLSNMVELCEGVLGNGTRLVAMKGAEPIGEIEQLKRDHARFAGMNIRTQKLSVPFLQAERHLVIIDC
jgi:16S rRNA (guanine527-N7)-methyltransferase